MEVIEVISSTTETEDIDRQWLPPAESRLSTIDVPLSEIRQHVEESRKTAQEALVSSDNAVIEPAQKQLDETHTAIYCLAVRMRPEWTQMEFQSFMRDLRYHQFLDLKHALDKRRSSTQPRGLACWPAPLTQGSDMPFIAPLCIIATLCFVGCSRSPNLVRTYYQLNVSEQTLDHICRLWPRPMVCAW